MAGKLEAALAWAARGFRVFPLQVNSKFPSDLAWTLHATTDPEVIRGWWTDPVMKFELDNNIGFLTTDWIVPDIDVKDGKTGLKTFFDLGLEFDTLTMATPSGGYHLVYQGIKRLVGSGHLVSVDDGLDIKSHNGYVVAPGSTIDGKAYTVAIDLPVSPFPEHLQPRLKSPRQRAESLPPEIELDAPELVEVVAHWLAHDAPIAVEGANGDDTTYKVACRMRDFGLSEQVAFELFIDEYNPRCAPPWDRDAARAKIENAYRYATGEIGSGSPAAAFGGVVTVEAPPHLAGVLTAASFDSGVYRFGNMIAMEEIEARPWIFGDILMARAVTTLIAGGGAGKSLWTLTLAAHNAAGKPFMGHEPHRPGSKIIIVNAEDDLAEQSRRLNIICEAYGLDKEVVSSRIALIGAEEDFALKLTVNRPPTINIEQVGGLIAAASDPDVAIIIVDPLVELHSAQENLVDEMSYVMSVLRMIARRTECAILVVHHTAKPPPANSSAWVGDANAGRGSTAVPAAARTVLTLFPAAEEDCAALGITVADRKRYVRLDGGKSNYAALSGKPSWLKWHSFKMPNGDSVGVLREHDAAASYDHAATDMADRLVAHMLKEGAASLPIEEAVTVLVLADPMGVMEDRDVLKSRIGRLLVTPRGSGDAKVQLVPGIHAGKKANRIVMR